MLPMLGVKSGVSKMSTGQVWPSFGLDEWEEPPPLWKSGAKEEELLRRCAGGCVALAADVES